MINIGPRMVKFILQGCRVIRVVSSLDLPVGFRFLDKGWSWNGNHSGNGRRGKAQSTAGTMVHHHHHLPTAPSTVPPHLHTKEEDPVGTYLRTYLPSVYLPSSRPRSLLVAAHEAAGPQQRTLKTGMYPLLPSADGPRLLSCLLNSSWPL